VLFLDGIVSCVFEVVGTFAGGDEVEKVTGPSPGGFMGSFFGFSHQVLELGEELLDRVEVWGIGRQEEEMSAGVTNGPARRFALVRAEIVEDDEIARLQGGGEYLLDIGGEQRAIDRPVDDARGLDSIVPERGDKGERLPMAVRDLGGQPLAFAPPAAQRGHVGLDPHVSSRKTRRPAAMRA
jgi:hypothetical protein